MRSLDAVARVKPVAPLADVGDQFGWVDHLEIGADRTEDHGGPVQGVRGHPQQAPLVIDVLDGAPPADLVADPDRRGVHQCLDGVTRWDVLDTGADERGGVVGGQLARPEPGPRAARLL